MKRWRSFLMGVVAGVGMSGAVVVFFYHFWMFPLASYSASPVLLLEMPEGDDTLEALRKERAPSTFWSRTSAELTQIAKDYCRTHGLQVSPQVMATGNKSGYVVAIGYAGDASISNMRELPLIQRHVNETIGSWFWNEYEELGILP